MADTFSSPAEHASRWQEARLFMPHGAFAFPYHGLELGDPPARASLGLPEKGPVLCAMHRAEKIDPELFDDWLQLLCERDDAVLWLLEGPYGMEQRLRARATRRGVPAHRLVFAPRVSVARHLARLQVADCFLDTRWHNGHTTMMDVIAAGVPPVGWLDEDVCGRLGATILRAAGLSQRIAHTLDGYLDLARRTISDPDQTREARTVMRDLRARAPLYDVAAFVRSLEEGYRLTVARARRGDAPADTHLPDAAYRRGRRSS